MDPRRFHWLESRFAELSPLTVERRTERLRELRAGGADAELLDKLERMLRLAEDGTAAPRIGVGDSSDPDGAVLPALEWARDEDGALRLGPYRALRRIGEGGMGEVYEAQQQGAVERRVAIKVLKRGLGTRAGIARFQVERQALAVLEHPGIARLYDAGTTGDDRPWFAMELVEGEPITRWCDRRALGVRARVELFVEVCRAVQHAHRHGILHRDLKPSNVLVAGGVGDGGGDDDEPARVKVIDFGIAKLVGEGTPRGERAFTRAGELVGTPEYMSPEQLAGDPARVDARTDVYSLGIVLFELLVGELPVAGGPPEGDLESLRRFLDRETPRPSSRIEPATGRAERVAAERATDPRTLARTLRRELDWIVLKALARERDQRYESPSALAADLEAWLAGEPVSVGPPTLRYRAEKMVRRHRVAFAAAVLVVLALVASTVIALFGLRQARGALERAEAEAATANEVTEFLVGLFEASAPGAPDAGRQTARELLDAGVERIGGSLGESPEVRARLLDTLGRIYAQLGVYDRGGALLRQGLELREASLGADHPSVGESLAALGELEVEGLDRPEQAIPLLERAVALLEAENARDGALLHALDALSHAYQRALRYDDAGRALERALGLARETAGARSRAVGDLLNRQGILAQERRDWEGSLEPLREAREILRETLGEDHVEVAILGTNLGWSLVQLGRPAEALPLMEHELEVSRRVFGARHQTVADTLLLMAPALTLLDRLDEAAQVLDEALGIYAEHLGGDHYAVAEVLYRRAELDVFAGDLAAARMRLEGVLARLDGSEHVRAPIAELRTLEWLAHVERSEGRFEAAREACVRAQRVLAERLPGTERSDCPLQLAWIEAREGRVEEARRTFEEALAVEAGAWALDRPHAPISRPAVLAALGDADAALAALEEGVERGFAHPWMARNPDLAPLRAHRRFSELLAAVAARLSGDPPRS